MKCPFCENELVPGENRRYETLIDHVFSPNQESFSLRPTWVCANNNCSESSDSFWDEFGDFYSRSYNYMSSFDISAIDSPRRKK
jgi:hypothetical protein